MDYEKKYKEALNWMRSIYPTLTGSDKEDAEHYFPELAESEDERIRKVIYKLMLVMREEIFTSQDEIVTKEKVLAYLEKQKERDLDIVPELRPTAWGEGYQHGCKDTEEKYSGMMVCSPEEWNEAISDAFKHGMDEGEKRKEQNSNIELIQKSWYMEGYHDREFNNEPKWIIKTGEGGPRYEENPKYGQHIEKQDYSGLTELEQAIHRGFLCAGVENVPVNIIKETAQDCLAHLPAEWSDDFDKEVENVHKRYPEVSFAKLTRIAYHFSKWANRYKDTEWSEEDETYLQDALWCIEKAEKVAKDEGDMGACWSARRWLKSLRPSWKPSEDEERLINTSISFLKDFADKGYENAVECIDWLKSKLNGNTCK